MKKGALSGNMIGILSVLAVLAGCGGGGDVNSKPIPAGGEKFTVLAWNDLGMHCLNPTYDTAVILPPYNTLWAQVIERGNPPKVVTSGVTVEFRILNNTDSYGKGKFAQFWDNSLKLFSVALEKNKGLNLDDPTVHNGLSGTMLVKEGHFQASGIPVVPYEDGSSIRNPYQVAEITVKDGSGAVVAQTRATVPTSDEINCGRCHAPGGSVTDVFNDVLVKHDAKHGTTLVRSKPVLCATCHGSPALGTSGAGTSGKYLSGAIHGSHAARGAACYDCHPGAATRCNRSTKHTAADGNCTACHGSMADIASAIETGTKVPWVNEPKCATCHTGVAEVDTAATLYRAASGHGGVFCAGCHGSPHAMVPSDQASDNYQALQYQSVAKSIGSCGVCHGSSKGEGAGEFPEKHNNSSSACGVCHTGFKDAGNTAKWPHKFQWKGR